MSEPEVSERVSSLNGVAQPFVIYKRSKKCHFVLAKSIVVDFHLVVVSENDGSHFPSTHDCEGYAAPIST